MILREEQPSGWSGTKVDVVTTDSDCRQQLRSLSSMLSPKGYCRGEANSVRGLTAMLGGIRRPMSCHVVCDISVK